MRTKSTIKKKKNYCREKKKKNKILLGFVGLALVELVLRK